MKTSPSGWKSQDTAGTSRFTLFAPATLWSGRFVQQKEWSSSATVVCTCYNRRIPALGRYLWSRLDAGSTSAP